MKPKSQNSKAVIVFLFFTLSLTLSIQAQYTGNYTSHHQWFVSGGEGKDNPLATLALQNAANKMWILENHHGDLKLMNSNNQGKIFTMYTDVKVTGNLTANSNLSIAGNLGASSIGISGAATFNGKLTANSDLSIAGNLEASSLDISGAATFNSGMTTLGKHYYNKDGGASSDSYYIESDEDFIIGNAGGSIIDYNATSNNEITLSKKTSISGDLSVRGRDIYSYIGALRTDTDQLKSGDFGSVNGKFGDAEMGSFLNDGIAWFGNKNVEKSSNSHYAVSQDNYGATDINSEAGQDLRFTIGGSTKLKIAPNGDALLMNSKIITLNDLKNFSFTNSGGNSFGESKIYHKSISELNALDKYSYAIDNSGNNTANSFDDGSFRVKHNGVTKAVFKPEDATFFTPVAIGTDENSTQQIDDVSLTVDGRVYISEEDGRYEGDNDEEEGFGSPTLDNFKDFLLWVEKGVVSLDYAVANLEDWPDYVFEEDYKLPSLGEVEQIIKEKGHLHTMPSAAHVETNGFTLTDITKRTVQTVEELTLYTIEQEKKIESLQESKTILEHKMDEQTKTIQKLVKRLNEMEKYISSNKVE